MLWHRQAIFESKGDKLSSSVECRTRTQGLRHLFVSKLSACWQTDWAIEDQTKNLNSTARPCDQQAFSPLDLTASWLLHILLKIPFLHLIQSHNSPCLHYQSQSINRDRGTLHPRLQCWWPRNTLHDTTLVRVVFPKLYAIPLVPVLFFRYG